MKLPVANRRFNGLRPNDIWEVLDVNVGRLVLPPLPVNIQLKAWEFADDDGGNARCFFSLRGERTSTAVVSNVDISFEELTAEVTALHQYHCPELGDKWYSKRVREYLEYLESEMRPLMIGAVIECRDRRISVRDHRMLSQKKGVSNERQFHVG